MKPGADPGFLRGRQLPRGDGNIRFAKFSRELHEIERIWVPGGPSRPLNLPLETPNEYLPMLRTVVSVWRGSRVGSTAVVRTPRPSRSPLDPRTGRTAHRGNTVTGR